MIVDGRNRCSLTSSSRIYTLVLPVLSHFKPSHLQSETKHPRHLFDPNLCLRLQMSFLALRPEPQAFMISSTLLRLPRVTAAKRSPCMVVKRRRLAQHLHQASESQGLSQQRTQLTQMLRPKHRRAMKRQRAPTTNRAVREREVMMK